MNCSPFIVNSSNVSVHSATTASMPSGPCQTPGVGHRCQPAGNQVIVEERQQRAEVALGSKRLPDLDPAHDLHVLLRHRPRSIPQAVAARDRCTSDGCATRLPARPARACHYSPSSAAVGCPVYGPAPVRFPAPQRAASARAASTSIPEPRPKVSPAANESPAP